MSDKTTCPHCGKTGFKKQWQRDRHIQDAHNTPKPLTETQRLLRLFDAKVGGYGDLSWDERT